MQKYNIYLDESSIDNPKNDFMVIGWIFIKRELKPKLIEEINEIKTFYESTVGHHVLKYFIEVLKYT